MHILRLLVIALFFLSAAETGAQVRVKEKVKDQTNNRVNQRVDQAIDKGLDKVEQGIGNIFRRDKPEEEEMPEELEAPAEVPAPEEAEEEVPEEATPAAVVQPQKTLRGATKYDFVPGDRILFYEDFSRDAVGDFPALWTTNGSGEVRTLEEAQGNWLYASSDEHVYCLMKDLTLPANFIFEFDVAMEPDEGGYGGFYLTFFNSGEDFMQDGLYPGTAGFHVTETNENWTVQGYTEEDNLTASSSELAPMTLNEVNHIIVWVQSRRLRIYHDGVKVVDGPTALPANSSYNRLRFSMWGHSGHPYFSNLKITAAAQDTRSKLLNEGKLVSYGIFFDSGEDVVKPESQGALADIARVLQENPGLRIRIVGHTDSDGNDALNLDLSKRRALAVRKEFESSFGIEGTRIETLGKGETEPAAPNSDPEGKARNRRVEFIKL